MARALLRASLQSLDGATPAFATGPAISVAGWINPTVVSVAQFPWTWDSADLNESAFVVVQASGVVQLGTVHGGGAANVTGATVIPAGAWTHVGGYFAASAQQGLLVNGGNKTTGTPRPCDQLVAMRFGQRNNANAFGGRLAEWALWSGQLSDEEFAQLARGYSPLFVRPAALLSYWPLYGDRSPEIDRKGRSALALTNGPTAGAHVPIIQPTRPRTGLYFLALPGTVNYLTPANGAIDQVAPVLAWAPSSAATAYDVYYGTSPVPPLVSSNQAGLTYTPTITAYDGTIRYWRIVAKNSLGSTPGPTWSFTLHQLPAIPNSPSPADGAIGVDAAASLSWLSARADTFDLYFGTVDPPPLLAPGLLAATYPLPDVEPVTRYYWRIRAINELGPTVGPVWQFRTGVGAIRVTARRLEAQLGPGFRATLITESFNVGSWPLSELARTQARDISGNNFHGAWIGSGFTGGISFDVPEGALGTRLNGNGFVEVQNYVASGDFNLSLANGDIDEAILVREYVLDSIKRALIAKHDGARATGNGWYVAVQGGAIEFSLIVAGATIFRFTRGALDALEHVITVCYRSADHEAFIAIDGVIQGAIVAVPSGIEPAPTAAVLRIGHFSDGAANDGLGFVGALAYASIGRQGDETWGPRLQAARVWSNLTAHARAAAPLETRAGIPGAGPTDNGATTGTFHFVLDNGYRVAPGYYTPGHPAARAGWSLGAPIRISFDFGGLTYYEHVGRLASVTPIAGTHGPRAVECTSVDYIDVLAGSPLSAVAAQFNQRSDFVMMVALDQAQGRSPASVEIHPGAGVWPYALEEGESERETVLTEASRIVTSERGFFYVKGDTTRGGRFVYEGHADRVGAPVRAIFDNTMQGLEVSVSLAPLVNIVRMTYTPRRVDPATVTLYTLDISQKAEPIEPGATRAFEGGYVDPTNLSERVGGGSLIPVSVAGGDIGFNSAADGSGSNLGASLRIVQALGGNSYRLELTNLHPTAIGYLRVDASTGFRIRGRGIYHYKPITIERRDNFSVRVHGPRRLEIDLGYESDGAVASTLAAYYLELYGVEQAIPSSLTIAANRTLRTMRAALGLQPGDTIRIGEPITGLGAASSRFVIHEKRLTYTEPGIVAVAFALAPSPLSLTVRRRLPSESGSA